MSTKTLDKTTLLDIGKLNKELQEAHRLLAAHGMDHYWTPNLETFSKVVLPILQTKVSD